MELASHCVEQLICQHTKASDPKLSPMPKQKRVVQIVAPLCACWGAAFFDVLAPRRTRAIELKLEGRMHITIVRLLRNSEPYVKTIGPYEESHYAQYSKENRRAQKI